MLVFSIGTIFDTITERSHFNTFSFLLRGCVGVEQVTSPAFLRTLTRSWSFILQVQTISDSITQPPWIREGQSAKTRGARGGFIRRVSAL